MKTMKFLSKLKQLLTKLKRKETQQSVDIEEILKQENQLIIKGKKKYAKYFNNTVNFIDLVSKSIIGLKNPDAIFFLHFFAQMRKHLISSLLNTLKLDRTGAMMDLRQTFEAGVMSAYALAFPTQETFIEVDKNGIAWEPKQLKSKCYKWLKKEFPKANYPIKKLKNNIQHYCHSNIIIATQNLETVRQKNKTKINLNYFGKADDDIIKCDLWFIGNIAKGFLDLLYGVNTKYPLLTFSDTFITELHALEAEENKFKKELMDKKRFQKMLQE